jgi:predicted  nucleic acid-binding Zn-ribbon protein
MSEPAKDFDLEHWKEVCYAHEAELEWLRAEDARLRESAELNADYHRREMKLQTEIASLALEESSALRAETARLQNENASLQTQVAEWEDFVEKTTALISAIADAVEGKP